ncbi:TonB-dependent receptor [Marinimicrobium locisalis]|uniref:TonB-dependent receptor n=1 Tax=Marinimicrobium locisalis TaxID=546022 RepID=UPI003221577E
MKMTTPLCCWLVCLPVTAVADPLQIEEITVIGRTGALLGHVASASEGSVNQQDLKIRPRLRVGDLLEAVPGMVATQHSGSGKANQYFLRGFNLDHGTDFATQLDGMPVNMRTHGHGQGYTDLNFVIPELIEGIHYRKGPYRSDVGDFTGAGSAVMRSVTETDTRISQTVGEYGYVRTLLAGDTDVAQGNLLYGLEYQTYKGPWTDVDESVEKKNLWLKQHWHTGATEYEVTLMAYDNQWNSADQIPERAVEKGIISELGSIDPTLGGESSRHSLSGQFQHDAEGGTLWRGGLYAIDYELSLWSNFTYFTDPAGDQFQQVDRRRVYGGELSRRHSSQWAGMDLRTTFGLQGRFDAIDEVSLNRSREREYLSTIRSDRVNEASYSAYWESRLAVTDSLSALAGARYDVFSFDVTPLAAAQPRTLAENGGEQSDDILTGSLSLIQRLYETQELYVSIGQGFHSNDARGVTLQRNPLSGETLSPADPLVDTLGYELGWRGQFSDGLNLTAALWALEIDSELIFVGDEGTTEDTDVGSDRRGVELGAYLPLGENWRLDLEYAWSRAQFERPVEGRRDVPGALDGVATVSLNWNPTERWFSHWRLRHLSDYALDGGERAGPSTMLNWRTGYRLSERFEISLDVLNLLNERDRDIEYYYESQLADESAPVADHHYHVFAPRSARITLEWYL